jgi:hypothetical protein
MLDHDKPEGDGISDNPVRHARELGLDSSFEFQKYFSGESLK